MDFTENDVGSSSDRPFRLKQRAWPIFAGRWRTSRRLRRLALALVTLVFTVSFFAACAAGLLFLRLSRGPIAVNLESQVSKALALRVKHGFHFNIGGTDVQTVGGRPTLVVRQLLVQDESGTRLSERRRPRSPSTRCRCCPEPSSRPASTSTTSR